VVLSGNTLYATASFSGNADGGMVFASKANGTVVSISFQRRLAIVPSGTNVVLM
jgi:hypothetical protein